MGYEHESPHQHPHQRHFHGSPGPVPQGFGPPEFGPPGFGPAGFSRRVFSGAPWGPPAGPWPGGRGRGRGGRRAKRGDVRAAALALLAEEPMNGYQIIQQIAERSGGLWRPSPGSVYPALQQLEDEGLVTVRSDGDGGGKMFTLTDAGREYVTAHHDELSAPWSDLGSDEVSSAAEMRRLMHQLHLAAAGVMSAGTTAQIEQAREVLAKARRELYRILAEDEPGPSEDA